MRKVAPLLKARADTKVLQPKPKQADAVYRGSPYAEWRRAVIARAGGRCQAVEPIGRCAKALPNDVMYADHIHEIADGGAPYDVSNGQCLCAVHHMLKTVQARTARLHYGGGGSI